MGEERCKVVKEEVDKLLNANFIRKVKYSTWLANVIMIKKTQQQMTNVHRLHKLEQGMP